MRVLHLVGSEVSAFHADLSRLYAADCLAATADPAVENVVAYVHPGGQWCFPVDLSPGAIAAVPPVSAVRAIAVVAGLEVDVVVPQMFCLPGMTTYRALFDLLAIPYVGNPPDVMALAAHKARAKAVVAGAGVDVPPGELLRSGDRPTVPLPVVVKPVDTDNSLGVVLVREAAELDAALDEAFSHSAEVLVETYVDLGREVRCGVLEVDGELVALPLEEYAVDRDDHPIRGYADKLRGAGDDLSLVAKEKTQAWMVDRDDPLTEVVAEVAKRCHRALGCRDYSLFDFRVDADGRPWFLEAGLYCSYAEKSVITMMAAADGRPLPEIFRAGLDQALARTPDRARPHPHPHQEESS